MAALQISQIGCNRRARAALLASSRDTRKRHVLLLSNGERATSVAGKSNHVGQDLAAPWMTRSVGVAMSVFRDSLTNSMELTP
jgi:hypothetical protein